MALNESQRKIAETTEGMIVADAGPGTGKSFTVVRYSFTNSASKSQLV